IDVLVNNAGIQFISKVEDFPLEKWNQVIGVIQTGTFLMTKHVLPSMKQQKKGRIVTISSAHGEMADPFKSAYVASKFAQIGFAKT
ncbi:SDR family NAD(P)-dependent oxidoreductase, partial [Mammaliicoccus sciuri]